MFKYLKDFVEDFKISIKSIDNLIKERNKIEEEHKKKEKEIYDRLLSETRKDLEKFQEDDETEECMNYIYPDYLKRKARVLAHDFNPKSRLDQIHNEIMDIIYARDRVLNKVWYIIFTMCVGFIATYIGIIMYNKFL